MLDQAGRRIRIYDPSDAQVQAAEKKETAVRARPPILRALGKDDPPNEISVEGQSYRLLEQLKHDSWAATAIYASRRGILVCKFNRKQPIFLIPMGWLGRLLARKESRLLQRFGHLQGIQAHRGPIEADGKILSNAVAHDFVQGHPLQENEPVD